MSVDFNATAADYSKHRQGFPPAFFERLVQHSLIGAGKSALDLGTGTGTLARGMALAGCHVTGLDIAPDLVTQARQLDAQANVNVSYHIAPAESSGLPDASFDLISAGQCWHWFNRPVVAAEVVRMLKPGGAALIAHLDWVPLAGNVVEATEALITAHNPAWQMGGGTGLYPAWLSDLALVGLQRLETFSFDIDLIYTHEAWRGRIRASAGISASLDAEAVERFDAALTELLLRRFPQDPLAVHHRVWAVFGFKL